MQPDESESVDDVCDVPSNGLLRQARAVWRTVYARALAPHGIMHGRMADDLTALTRSDAEAARVVDILKTARLGPAWSALEWLLGQRSATI